MSSPLVAATSYDIDSPQITRDFILTGDNQGPARDGVAVSMSADISTDTSESADYRFLWELQVQASDGSWSVVPLVASNDSYATQAVFVDIDNDSGTPEPSSQTIFESDSFETSQVLDPYKNYRIRGRLQKYSYNVFLGFYTWSTVGGNEYSGSSNLYQFTNTSSADDPLNIIATLDSTSLSNPFLLDGATSPDKRAFTVDLAATVRRWDRYDSSVTSSYVRFEYEVELREKSTGNVIPLQQSTFSDSKYIDSYFYNSFTFTSVPRIRSISNSLQIIPSEQLDPLNEEYEVDVTITHKENPITGTYATGNVQTLQDLRLYDFNGELYFGGRITQLKNFTRDPQPSTTDGAGYVAMTLTGVDGHLDGLADYTYDATSSVSIHLLADGTATVQGLGANIPITPPNTPDTGTAAGVRFQRENTELQINGLYSDLTAYLPQGMGYVPVGGNNRRLAATIDFSGVSLDDQLGPQNAALKFIPGSPVRVLEETKPAYVTSDQILWETTTGKFTISHSSGNAGYVRDEEADYLAGAPVDPAKQTKADNSGYYHALASVDGASSLIVTDVDGTAEMDVAYNLNSGSFKTHFPYGVAVPHSGGEITIAADAVTAGFLNLSSVLTLTYDQTCAADACGTGEQEGSLTLDPGALVFTADGGLVGSGSLQGTGDQRQLSWGYIEALSSSGSPVYAQQLGAFSNATFHATGHFIRGAGGSFAEFNSGGAGDRAARSAPADTLLAAVKGTTETDARTMARPGSTADQGGNYYYAGINLETASDGAVTGVATIGDQTVPYGLRGCNKFYVRKVGVTGTVEAVPGSFPQALTILGYDFAFDYYGLGYLDSTTSPSGSFTKGSVATPFPTDATFNFEGLSFTCLGGLAEARLPTGGLATLFDYWNADIDIAALGFTSSGSCNPANEAYLTLGATGYSTLVDQPLHGTVGVRPNGQLIDLDFSLAEGLETQITSRFRLPNSLKLDGPEEEQYELTTVSEAYLNAYDATSEQTEGDGRLNFAAKIDVPFFEDLAGHIRTTASKNTNPKAVADLMGGWTEGGQTFFTTSFFDTGNRGFPAGVDEALYRNESGASGDPTPYLITARQEWLNVVEFSYPLDWSSALRTFSAFKPEQQEDLLVIQVDHQLDYLSAERAEISFGAQYEGLPRINLTNFVFNKIEEQTGVLQAATDALRGETVDALDQGIQQIDSLLQDQIDDLIEGFMAGAVDPIIDDLYGELQTAASTTNTVTAWQTEVGNKAEKFFVNNVDANSQDLRAAIQTLAKPVGEANSVIAKIDNALEDLQIALRSVHDRVYLENGEVKLTPPSGPYDTLDGLLYEESGEFQIVETLIARLIDEVGGELGDELAGMLNDSLSGPTGELQDLINEQLDKVRPSLERIRAVIAELDSQIGDIRNEIEDNTAFLAEFEDILNAADSQIQAATADLRDVVDAFILADIPAPDRFEEYTAEEIKQRIRSEIKDKIRGMAFVREFQQVIRQKLYDVDLAIKEGIDSAFAQVNTTLKNLLSQYLAGFDDSINGAIGDINSVVGSGEFDGFAHINGDALRLLRVDAAIQFKVPKEMEFEGYFQIKQLASDGSGSCSYSAEGTPAKEITLGTPGVPVEWLSPGMEIAVEGKVTYSDKPLGLGGKIEMVGGSFNFEAFEITDLGAAMSFGKTENYLAAKVGLKFQSYDVYGGVFFGQTCTITPVELVNEEAAGVIGSPDPTFTGAYVYGEAHIPVSEAILGIPATCMFRITAGVGAGAFYFVEGPTFGGQILLAVSGEALCLVGVNGEVSMIGAKVGDDLRYRGRGTVGGRVGSCPLCVKFSKSIILEYINDRWKFQL
ncbi:hypothetical protein [Coraliomargarita sinensis]|uniref:hypothetical protein n=1 Tax=Coraliomargarita sinensis TaxID=2174842 RepID=UPI0011B71E73|nr:hypothetical protein [Coraliomargarita sinensis]